MIRLHEFNTQWSGEPAGIIDDGAFFTLPHNARQVALASFRWAEFKSRLDQAPSFLNLHRAGFFLADVQEEFRVALKAKPENACAQALDVQFADEQPFDVEDSAFASFEHERYQHLPGYSQQRINARYGEWSRLLLRQSPETCLQVLVDGVSQGWFLSRPAPTGLNLALAMLRKEARISGYLLYERALSAYAARGHRIGWASFSETNTAVHNIYAKLGAHFVPPVGIWFWLAEGLR